MRSSSRTVSMSTSQKPQTSKRLENGGAYQIDVVAHASAAVVVGGGGLTSRSASGGVASSSGVLKAPCMTES